MRRAQKKSTSRTFTFLSVIHSFLGGAYKGRGKKYPLSFGQDPSPFPCIKWQLILLYHPTPLTAVKGLREEGGGEVKRLPQKLKAGLNLHRRSCCNSNACTFQDQGSPLPGETFGARRSRDSPHALALLPPLNVRGKGRNGRSLLGAQLLWQHGGGGGGVFWVVFLSKLLLLL